MPSSLGSSLLSRSVGRSRVWPTTWERCSSDGVVARLADNLVQTRPPGIRVQCLFVFSAFAGGAGCRLASKASMVFAWFICSVCWQRWLPVRARSPHPEFVADGNKCQSGRFRRLAFQMVFLICLKSVWGVIRGHLGPPSIHH